MAPARRSIAKQRTSHAIRFLVRYRTFSQVLVRSRTSNAGITKSVADFGGPSASTLAMRYTFTTQSVDTRAVFITILVSICTFTSWATTSYPASTPATNDTALTTVILAVILPHSNRWMFSLARVVPALQVAIGEVVKRRLLPSVRLRIRYADSACSPVRGPLRAFEMRRTAGVFIGPFCDYSLSPVARYAAVWDTAVVTPGGMAHDFGADKLRQFRTLTRVGATFNSLAWSLYSCIRRSVGDTGRTVPGGGPHASRRVKVLYTPDGHGEVVARFCYLAVSAFVRRLKHSKGLKYHLFLFRPSTDLQSMFIEEVGLKYSG